MRLQQDESWHGRRCHGPAVIRCRQRWERMVGVRVRLWRHGCLRLEGRKTCLGWTCSTHTHTHTHTPLAVGFPVCLSVISFQVPTSNLVCCFCPTNDVTGAPGERHLFVPPWSSCCTRQPRNGNRQGERVRMSWKDEATGVTGKLAGHDRKSEAVEALTGPCTLKPWANTTHVTYIAVCRLAIGRAGRPVRRTNNTDRLVARERTTYRHIQPTLHTYYGMYVVDVLCTNVLRDPYNEKKDVFDSPANVEKRPFRASSKRRKPIVSDCRGSFSQRATVFG